MTNITTFDILNNEISKISGKPKVLEALWDGDTQGWFLNLFLYVETESSPPHKELIRYHLGHITLGSDIRIFSGGKWHEATLAKEFGEKAALKYDLEFYFPSDKEPDNDCPEWTEKHLAIHCADCNKLIIPTDNMSQPKEICYPCHLTREQNKILIDNTPIQNGVVLYLSNDSKSKKLGFWSTYEDLMLSKFYPYCNLNLKNTNPIEVFVLEYKRLTEVKMCIENELNLKLDNFSSSKIDETHRRFLKSIYKQTYKGLKYDLDIGNEDHLYILESISTLEYLDKAIGGNYNLNICFINGLRYREDSFLRFIHYLKKGRSSINELTEHYEKHLLKSDIIETIEKLKDYGCIHFDGFEITLSELGSNIV